MFKAIKFVFGFVIGKVIGILLGILISVGLLMWGVQHLVAPDANFFDFYHVIFDWIRSFTD